MKSGTKSPAIQPNYQPHNCIFNTFNLLKKAIGKKVLCSISKKYAPLHDRFAQLPDSNMLKTIFFSHQLHCCPHFFSSTNFASTARLALLLSTSAFNWRIQQHYSPRTPFIPTNIIFKLSF